MNPVSLMVRMTGLKQYFQNIYLHSAKLHHQLQYKSLKEM